MPHWRLFQHRRRLGSIRCVDGFHTVHHVGWKTSRRVHMVRRSGWQRSKQHPGLTTCGQRYGKTGQKQRNETKNKWAIEKPKLDNAKRLRRICFIDPADADASSYELQDQGKNVQGNLSQSWFSQDQIPNTHASLKPTNLRESLWKELCKKIMKDHFAGKGMIHWTITILYTSLFPCFKQWRYWMRQLRSKKNATNSWKYQRGSWRKSETRKMWSRKQRKKAKQYILLP